MIKSVLAIILITTSLIANANDKYLNHVQVKLNRVSSLVLDDSDSSIEQSLIMGINKLGIVTSIKAGGPYTSESLNKKATRLIRMAAPFLPLDKFFPNETQSIELLVMFESEKEGELIVTAVELLDVR